MAQQKAPLSCQKEKFSLSPDSTYLNCAYMAPLLKSVEDAGINGLKLKQAPQQIGHYEFFDLATQLREAYAQLINSTEPSRIAIQPSVSYGMASIAKNLKIEKGDNIVMVGEQFPSNVYTWQKLCAQHKATLKVVDAPMQAAKRGKLWNERLLEAIDKRTRLLAMAHVHWSDGTKFDLPALRKRTHDVGALLVIDGTQSVGALPFDMQEVQADALVCAGYKWLLGPYSIALSYFGEAFDDGEPLEEGWISRKNSDDFASLVNYQNEYQEGALRYEVGERSNFILVPMILQAIKEINCWGVQNIQNYCEQISNRNIETLAQLGFMIEAPTFRGHHLFGVRLPEKVSIQRLQEELKSSHISVSIRGNSVRVSPHLYNDERDMDKLLQCFSAMV